jgi:signal transduction histidine kinase
MAVETKPNSSLWWKLSWQLSVIFAGVIAAVIIGISVYGAIVLSPNISLKHELGGALVDAVGRDSHGRLLLLETPHLKAFKAENEGLWFVIAAGDPSTVSYGPVPAAYTGLASYIYLVKDADIRGAHGVGEAASIDDIETVAGNVRVMYGGRTDRSSAFLTLLAATYPIYVPLLAIAVPAIFLTVPRIVSRALAGLKDVVKKAPEIDPRRAGGRLPTTDVPSEVIPLIVAFNSILDRLEKQFQVRQRFLIDAAHELRTPIAIMQTRIEGMSDDREQRRLMADVARLGETAEQLLDFERNDQATDVHEPVDLVEIARSVVADLAPMAIAGGYEISFESDVDQVERQGCRPALQRAISNLVRNAIDHGGNKGAISVMVSWQGEIAVSDEGPGIPEDQREQVFEPFYRLTPRSTGAGLGLSLVKQIVANHHGQVTIDSAPSGTTFKIWL